MLDTSAVIVSVDFQRKITKVASFSVVYFALRQPPVADVGVGCFSHPSIIRYGVFQAVIFYSSKNPRKYILFYIYSSNFRVTG